MSGHSKWSTIKRQKGAADQKRGVLFTKLGKSITIAVKEGGGGDPASNFKLRLAMDQARASNMPKENVQRAIERGLGKGGAGSLETAVYEAYGPGQVALIIEATTDNKNRTTGEIKNLIEKNGGRFVSPGTVSWSFSDFGVITLNKEGKTTDEFLDLAIEAGAEDVEEAGEMAEVFTKPNDLENVKNKLVEKGLSPLNAEVIKKSSQVVEISDADSVKKVLDLVEKLEDHDDVSKVHSNFDIPDNLLEQVQGS
ncbi:MAG TPA: YebC/PmpR family DNA-binding transcriptional regulator [Patescibacteria group bacterium]